VIAAVGHLSVAKGAAMVNALAHGAQARGLPIRFVVAGTTDRPDPGVTATGAFERERLPDLLERLGADGCLLPSLIPETYSYLADELMQTGLPLAVFDVGAPPERVRRYPGGLVLPIEPGEALDAIMCDWVADSRRATGMEHS
jgi:glycosyltransferase involved in cell wall biosynthesis